MPLLSGGSTVPPHRLALSTGVAAVLPTHRSSNTHATSRIARTGGVVPVVAARIGMPRQADLGLVVSGTSARADLRKRWQINNPLALTRLSILAGISPFGGWLDADGPGHLVRTGLEVPVVFAVDASSVVELWTGVRTGVEFAWGDLEAASGLAKSHAFGLRIGPVLGLGLGFRHLAALAELTVFIEHWTGEHANEDLSVTGVNLVPATALRILF